MNIPFVRRKGPKSVAEQVARATRIGSAEAAWPLRGGGRSRAELRAASARVRRYRAAAEQGE